MVSRRFTLQPRERTSATQLLAQLRQLEGRRLQQMGEQALAEQAASIPTTQLPPSLPIQEAMSGDKNGGWLSFLGNILGQTRNPLAPQRTIADMGRQLKEGFDQYTTVSETGTAFGHAFPRVPGIPQIPGIPKIPGLDIQGMSMPSSETQSDVRSEIKKMFTEQQGFGTTSRRVREIHKAQPTSKQIIQEALGPVGLIETLLPIGGTARLTQRATRPAVEAVKAGTKKSYAALPLSSTTSILEQLQAPGAIRNLVERAEKLPGNLSSVAEWGIKAFSDTALAKATHPIHRAWLSRQRWKEQADDISGLLERTIHEKGDLRKIFGTDTSGIIQPGLGIPFPPASARKASMVGRSFQEVAQHPGRFAMAKQHREILDHVNQVLKGLHEYARKSGAPVDDVLGKVPGRYFPNFWKYLDDIRLDKKPGDDIIHSRIHEEATVSRQRGYTGDPLEAIQIFANAQYKSVADHRTAQILKPVGHTMEERLAHFGGPLMQEVKNAKRISDASVKMNRIVLDFLGQGIPDAKRIGRMRNTQGAKAAREHFPEIMEDLEKILRRGKRATPRSFKAAKELLEARATAAKDDAKDIYSTKLRGQAELREKVRYRYDLGERMYEDSIMGDRIFTPDKTARQIFHNFPEAALTDFTTIVNGEMLLLERMLADKVPGMGELFLSGTQKLSSLMRTMMTAFDAGVSTIHLLPLMAKSPSRWAKAMEFSVRGLWDKELLAKELMDHRQTIQEMADKNMLHGAGSDLIESLTDGGLIKQGLIRVGDIPRAGKIVKPLKLLMNSVEDQFNGSILLAKIYLYEAFRPMAVRANKLNELPDVIAKATGTVSMANLGINPTMSSALGAILLFAPRYSLAVSGFMLDAVRPGFKGQVARDIMGKLMIGGLLMYAGIAHRLKQPMHLDPTSSKFLTIKVGNTNVGIGSKFVQLSRFAAGGMVQAFKEPDELFRIHKDDSVVHRFIRSNLSPLSGMGWDTISGRNFMGEPTTGANFFKQGLPDHLLPFWASGFMDDPRPGWAGVPSEFFGLRSYPVSLYERATDLANIEAHKIGDSNYKDLNKKEQALILKNNPEIKALFDENNQLWAGRGERVNQFKESLREFREERFDVEVEKALGIFRNTLDGEQLRRTYSQLSAWKRLEYLDLREKYNDVIELLAGRERNPNAHIEDIAYDEYIREVVTGDFSDPTTGEFDFKARDKAAEDVRQKYGDEIFKYIQERNKVNTDPVLDEWFLGRTHMKNYWNVGEAIMRASGNEELLPHWENYYKADAAERALLVEELPLLSQVATAVTRARQAYRDTHQAEDAWLYRWGYVGKPRHPGNIDRDLTEIKRTQVFFD